MHFSLILLHLAGAIVLLLYAVHLVRTGMERAHGATLRSLLGQAREGRLGAAAGGALMAVMLQSSTAAAMLACGFAASGVLALTAGIALLLGADLGSSIVVRVLSFDLEWLIPVCLAVGGLMHIKFSTPKIRETGRMILGVGFILLSLQMIATATGPLRDGELVRPIAAYLGQDYVTAFLVGALFAWVVHSSVAAILMTATFTAQGLIPLDAGAVIVLGANAGSALVSFWLSRAMPVQAARLPVSNALFVIGFAIVVLVAMETFGAPVEMLGSQPASALVNFHVLFNVALVIVSLPLVRPMARLVEQIVPDKPAVAVEQDPLRGRASALDRSVAHTPRLALANATRELLRMGELVEVMVRPVMELLNSGTPAEIDRVRAIDRDVNHAHTDIKLYLAEMNRGEMTADERQVGVELTDFAINLEYAGDIVAKNLLVLAQERARKKVRFSAEGWSELLEIHQRLLENMHLALNVLVSRDLPSARQLVKEKERMRDLVRASHDNHLLRLQSGTAESIQTSSMHLEIARGLKEINSLVVTVAYPILTRSGELLESRLASAER